MTPVDLAERTTEFALRVIKLYSALPKKTEAQSIHPSISSFILALGEVQEWLNWQHWKCCERETVPWVRIPPSPPVIVRTVV